MDAKLLVKALFGTQGMENSGFGLKAAVFVPEQWLDVLQDGSHCWCCHPLSEALEREIQSFYISKHEALLCSSQSQCEWEDFLLMTNCKQCKIAAGSAPHSPQSIAVHWFICFFHCCLFSSPHVVVHSVILELKSKISKANYSGLLTQVARNHEQKK